MELTQACGHPVSAAQLERWRRKGLLPSSVPQYLGRHGSRRIYPPETGALACTLARYSAPGRSLDLVALLAFFNQAEVPETPVKVALADAYFASRFTNEAKEATVTEGVPADLRIVSPEYESAEAEAVLELRGGGRAVRQMRLNLRRLPELQHATQAEVDQRLIGVLTALNRIALPTRDLDIMADLDAALDLEALEHGSAEYWREHDVLAVWEWAAISHVAQIAEYNETSPQERLHLLFSTSWSDLIALRDEVRDHFDQMWARATWRRETTAQWDSPWLVRRAAAALMEWMSARLVHPPGSVLSERYFSESLADLRFACLRADVERARLSGASPDVLERLVDRLVSGIRSPV